MWIAARAAEQHGQSLAALDRPKWISPGASSYRCGQPQTSVDVGQFGLGGSAVKACTLANPLGFYSAVAGTASMYHSQVLTAGLRHL